MADRPTFDGQRQRDALARLQKQADKDATTVARDVSLSYPQYNRYLWGRVPLRSDQFAAFAAAYGVTVEVLVQELGYADAEPTPADLTAALYAMGYQPDEAPVVDRVVTRLLELSPKQRRQVLALMTDAVEIKNPPDDPARN